MSATDALTRIISPKWLFIVALSLFSLHINRWVRRQMTRRGMDDRLARVLSLGFLIALWFIGAEWLLSEVVVAPVSLTLGGVVALMVLGLSQSASRFAGDVMASFMLRADPHFKKGAQIGVGSVEGRLVSVEMRQIRLRDVRGDLHVVPIRHLDELGYVIRRLPRSYIRTADRGATRSRTHIP